MTAADRRRVSEDTLLAMGVVGGLPGAIVAQQVPRYKSGKASFRERFRSGVIVEVAGFIALDLPLKVLLWACGSDEERGCGRPAAEGNFREWPGAGGEAAH